MASHPPADSTGTPHRIDAADWSRLQLVCLGVLAALQAGLLLTIDAPVARRIVAYCLLVVTLVEWWRPWLTAPMPHAGTWLLGLCGVANFAAFLLSNTPPFEARLMQAAVVLGYLGTGVAAVASRIGPLGTRRSYLTAAVVTGLLLVAELMLDGRSGKYLWAGGVPLIEVASQDVSPASAGMGWSAMTEHPFDPTGYAEDPEDLKAEWNLGGSEGPSAARIEFPRAPADAFRLVVTQPTRGEGWSIRPFTRPFRVRQGDAYLLTFRARAAVRGVIGVSFSLSEPPWNDAVPFQMIEVDTIWQSYRLELGPALRNANATLHFDVGRITDTIEFSRVRLVHQLTDRALVPSEPRRHLVRYFFDPDGCRSGQVTPGRGAGARRILVIGGASAMGLGVHGEDTFSSLLRERLAEAHRESPPDVLNCGTSIRDPSKALASFRQVIASYSPDLVLLAVGPHDGASSITSSVDGNRAFPGRLARLLLTWNQVREAWSTRRLPGFREQAAHAWPVEALAGIRDSLAADRLMVIGFRTDSTPIDSEFTQRLREASQSAGVLFVDTGDALLRRYRPSQLVLDPDLDLHPNAVAHALAADTVARFLFQRPSPWSQ